MVRMVLPIKDILWRKDISLKKGKVQIPNGDYMNKWNFYKTSRPTLVISKLYTTAIIIRFDLINNKCGLMLKAHAF